MENTNYFDNETANDEWTFFMNYDELEYTSTTMVIFEKSNTYDYDEYGRNTTMTYFQIEQALLYIMCELFVILLCIAIAINNLIPINNKNILR
jgi:hypothetical protein